jgi:cyclomaltodextrinase / maltogenic alpha-amylase / neopullulanase
VKRFWAVCALLWPVLAAAQEACRAAPLGGRTLYLRGTFNSWGAADAQAFTWACNRYELVTPLNGEHSFKVADEGWSADADFGQGAGNGLKARGPEFKQRFNGTQRFTVAFKDGANVPELSIEACPAPSRPTEPVLYLRGTMNNWAALDDYAFRYSCDAFYLNVQLSGMQEFRIADATWNAASTFSQDGGNFSQLFAGEQTLRLTLEGGKPQLSVGPKTFADTSAKAVTDPVALSLRFDSRAFKHKSPFGAVVAGSTLDFAVNALPGVDQLRLVIEKRRLEGNQEVLDYSEVARLPMRKTAHKDGRQERFGISHRFDATGIYGYWFEAQISGKTYVYQNNNAPIFWTREKGAGGLGVVSDKPPAVNSIRRFRQTVYAPNFNVPTWAADTVYYYIFPDRYRNGDRKNDPQPGVARYQNQTVELHQNWNERPFKPGSGDGTGDGSDAIYNNDFFGGDLAGIIQKLDTIKSLGANTIYMTPIFKATTSTTRPTTNTSIRLLVPTPTSNV